MVHRFDAESTVPADERVAVRGGRLEVVATGHAIHVAAERKVIGRGAGCDLIVDDKTVSAIHVEACGTDRGLRLVDIGTRNGTHVGAIRVIEAFLVGPAEIRCGSALLRFTPSETEELVMSTESRFGALVGATHEMLALFNRLRKFARSDVSILIHGETGTGKELVARAIHQASSRSAAPFVAVNCAALAEDLLEAELFGHEKGAFTGADRARAGLFVEADGGTLFLDEIAEMSPRMQVKLLRVVQEGEVRPVGGTRSRKVSVRTLLATHADLAEAANDRRFRADLFFRLAQVKVEVPPLRKRVGDIPLLVRRILEDLGRAEAAVDPETMKLLQARTWPGNVRELRNAIEVALAASEGGPLVFDEAFSLAHPGREPILESLTFDTARQEFKRRYYTALYAACRGNISQIARRAKKQRSTVREALREAGIAVGGDDAGD